MTQPGKSGFEPRVPRYAGGPLTAGPPGTAGRWAGGGWGEGGGGANPLFSALQAGPLGQWEGEEGGSNRVSPAPSEHFTTGPPGTAGRCGGGEGFEPRVPCSAGGYLTAGPPGTARRWGGGGGRGSNPESPALQVDTLPLGHREQPEGGEEGSNRVSPAPGGPFTAGPPGTAGRWGREGKGEGDSNPLPPRPSPPLSRRTPCLQPVPALTL